MTGAEAIHGFFSGFGLPAYRRVPPDAEMPYLTYSLTAGDILTGETAVNCDLWYLTESEAAPNRKAAEIYGALGLGGVLLPFDGGAVWLKRGSPWCRGLEDAQDKRISRRNLLLLAEFLCG